MASPVQAWSRVDGLLLAGGRSRRFGSDKRRALLGERTMAAHALALLRSACDGTVFVAGRHAFDRPVDALELRDADVGAGPLAGLVAGLLRCRDGLLVLPCDVPLLGRDALVALATVGRRTGRTVVLRGPSGVEPLVAHYPRSALPFLAASLRGGHRAVHRLLPRLAPLFVEVGCPGEALNVNRPEDLATARGLPRPSPRWPRSRGR